MEISMNKWEMEISMNKWKMDDGNNHEQMEEKIGMNKWKMEISMNKWKMENRCKTVKTLTAAATAEQGPKVLLCPGMCSKKSKIFNATWHS
jgi:hypothetical protein